VTKFSLSFIKFVQQISRTKFNRNSLNDFGHKYAGERI